LLARLAGPAFACACQPAPCQHSSQSSNLILPSLPILPVAADKGGNPKGFAYIEFLEADAVANACLLDGSELRSRQIKVAPKRTNVPGMKQVRGGRGGRGRGGRGGFPYGGYGMMPMMPPPFMFGYGGFPYGGGGRGRGRGRGGRGGYQPY
jgi:polyadenylate-binding protein 2